MIQATAVHEQYFAIRTTLERKDNVEELVAKARLLDIGEVTLAAVGNPRFGDFIVGNRVA